MCAVFSNQAYTINGAKVIFLKQRPQSRAKMSSNICFTCDRILQEPFHFCSLSCKVDYLVYQRRDLSSIIYHINKSDFAFLRLVGVQDNGSDPAADEDSQLMINLNPMSEHNGSSALNHCRESSAISNRYDVKNKKKSGGFLSSMVHSLGSRRKGAPQRAPLS